MNHHQGLLSVLALSLFSFSFFTFASSLDKSAVLGDSTQKIIITSTSTSAIPCQVITPITDTYCQDDPSILCQTLKYTISSYCQTPSK